MQKYLIVKTSALGDIIQSFPVLHYLKEQALEVQIDWVVEEQGAEIVRSHPWVTRTLTINTRAWRRFQQMDNLWAFRRTLRECEYDAVFDLQSNMKSGLITCLAKSKNKVGFGWGSVHEWPNILATNKRYVYPKGKNIRSDYLFLAESFFKEEKPFVDSGVLLKITEAQEAQLKYILENPVLFGRPKVMVCPGSAWANKQMTEEALALLLQQIQKQLQCAFVFMWGSSAEQQFALRLQQQFPRHGFMCERLSIPTLQNLMGKMDLVLAMDSLPLHLAGTTATPSFSIFGPSLAQKFMPLGDQHQTFQGSCPYGRTFEKRCPILRTCPSGACIRGLSGEEVFASFHKDRAF